MKYYARTYTADPKTGLLSPGEFLKEEQAAALGKDRLAEMVARGVLCAVGSESPKAQEPDDEDVTAAVPDPEADNPNEDTEDGEDDAEGEEELMELDGAGAIDAGDEPEEKPAKKPAKNGGGRKQK